VQDTYTLLRKGVRKLLRVAGFIYRATAGVERGEPTDWYGRPILEQDR